MNIDKNIFNIEILSQKNNIIQIKHLELKK